MAEPFSIKKLFLGIFSGVFWVKVVVYMMAMAFLIAVCYGVYQYYFAKKPVQQTQTQTVGNITVQSGGHLNMGQQTTEAKSKWAWYVPHPFVEAYAYKEDDRDGVGGRFGGRWEF